MRYLLITCIALSLAIPGAGMTAETASEPTPATHTADADTAATVKPDTPSLQDLERFSRAYHIIRQTYVEELDDEALLDAAIKGMIQQIDSHGSYLKGDKLKEFEEETTGEYSGIGIEVGKRKHQLTVIAPIDDTPAAAAGIKAGDVIIRIDGVSVDPNDIQSSIDQLRGKAGTKVTLTLLPAGASKPVSKTLTRKRIKTTSTTIKDLETDYMYVRISQFQRNTGVQLYQKLERYLRKHGMPRGMILDLRNNPGGIVTSATSIADLFLDSGDILSMRGRDPEKSQVYKAKKGDMLDGAPIVVLVNAGSASAAEILAGALQDNKRAVLVGEKTFGKGVVQTLWNMDEDHALKVTTQRYYTPSGRSIQAKGIVPDIAVAELTVEKTDATDVPRRSEANLPNHLAHESDDADDDSTDVTRNADDMPPLAQSDYVLAQGLNVLKGMALGR